MSTTVAIDPGLRELGVAVFSGRELVRAFLVKNPERQLRGPAAWQAMAEATVAHLDLRPDVAVVEIPQVYRESRAPSVDPDDLIQLVGVEAMIIGRLQPLRSVGYRPREWKGQVRKDAHNKQTLALLSAPERMAIQECAPSYLHNVLDAVGLGLFQLKRAGPNLSRAGILAAG